jgi:antitoxin (DNA-binding transcriptional repressor) of toxin-antitoxin stability system
MSAEEESRMEEIPISKFKATCLAVLEKVRRTGQPIRVTRFGKVVAEVVPPQSKGAGKAPLGGMEGKLIIVGDIISPIVGVEEWEVLRDETAAGHSHLDLERLRSRPAPRKGPQGTGKRR